MRTLLDLDSRVDMVTAGFQLLWEAVAADHDVRLEHPVMSRCSRAGQQGLVCPADREWRNRGLRNGYFANLQEMQGKRATYYAGSMVDYEFLRHRHRSGLETLSCLGLF